MKKIKIYSYVIVFLALVLGLGLSSYRRLVNFYVNEELDYNEWTPELGTKFETDIASTFYKKVGFVNLNGAVSRALNQHSMNGIYKLKNGHLISPQAKIADEEVEKYANEVIDYANYCKSKGKPFLFVQPILKIDEDNKQLPDGVEDYNNENIDYLIECLRASDIEVLDIRKCMKDDGMDMYDYTYKTDHHWTTVGCFYAFSKITKWIDKETGVAADPQVADIDQYEIVTYPKWHLGSYGQRTGEYFAGIDDYDLILPKFDVSFADSEGKHSFYEQVVNEEIFKMRDANSRYTYDHALKCPEGVASTSRDLSVLFVSDSYATAMAPYIKLAYSEYLYQYYPNGFDKAFVDKVDPDVVIVMPYNLVA